MIREARDGGLVEAMNSLYIESGVIVTLDQEDLMYDGGKEIRVVPIWI